MLSNYLRGLAYIWADRWTLFSRVLIPLFITLLILSLILGFVSKSVEAGLQQVPLIAISLDNTPETLRAMLEARKDIKLIDIKDDNKIKNINKIDSISLGLLIPADFENLILNGKQAKLEMFYNSGMDFTANKRVRSILNDYEILIQEERVKKLNIDPDYINPFNVVESNSYSPFAFAINNIASSIALITIMFGFLACIYPSIETAAIHLGKNLVAFVGRLMSTLTIGLGVSLLSVLLLKWSLIWNNSISTLLKNSFEAMTSAAKIGKITLILIPCIFFFTAILTLVGMMGKNFKRAQNTIQPLKLVVLFLLIWAFVPTLQLSWKIAWMPVLNTAVSIREIISGSTITPMMLISGGFLVLYSLIALTITKRYLY